MADNETARFLGDPSEWAGARVALADIHGLWGGCNVTLVGNGECAVTLVRQPHHRDGSYYWWVSETQVQRVLDLCIAHDFVTIRFPPRPFIVPDESRPEITLTNAAGEQHTVGCWANDPKDPGFEAIYAALLAFAEGVEGEPPIPPNV
jgi:hypothetical protein